MTTWIEEKDEDGRVLARYAGNDVKIYRRRIKFEAGYCEVWTDDFDRMYEIIDQHVTCPRIGFRLVPKLMRLAEFDTGEIVVDQSALAEQLNVSRQELNRTLKEFVELGLLEFLGKRSRHNVYRLPERVIWKGTPKTRLKVIDGKLDNICKGRKEKKEPPSQPK